MVLSAVLLVLVFSANILALRLLSEVRALNTSQFAFSFFTVALPRRASDEAQNVAVASWLRLAPRRIVIFVEAQEDCPSWVSLSPVIQCKAASCRHNLYRAVTLDCVFQQMQASGVEEVVVFVNSDIVLSHDFTLAVTRTLSEVPGTFVIVGERRDVSLSAVLDAVRTQGWDAGVQYLASNTPLHGIWGLDYFVFRSMVPSIPNFMVGVPRWDNFLMWYV